MVRRSLLGFVRLEGHRPLLVRVRRSLRFVPIFETKFVRLFVYGYLPLKKWYEVVART